MWTSALARMTFESRPVRPCFISATEIALTHLMGDADRAAVDLEGCARRRREVEERHEHRHLHEEREHVDEDEVEHVGGVVARWLVEERRVELLVAAVHWVGGVLELDHLELLALELLVRLDGRAPRPLVARLPAAAAAERLEGAPLEHLERVVVELADRREVLHHAADRREEVEALRPLLRDEVGVLVEVVYQAGAPDRRGVLRHVERRLEELEVGGAPQLGLQHALAPLGGDGERALLLERIVLLSELRAAVAQVDRAVVAHHQEERQQRQLRLRLALGPRADAQLAVRHRVAAPPARRVAREDEHQLGDARLHVWVERVPVVLDHAHCGGLELLHADVDAILARLGVALAVDDRALRLAWPSRRELRHVEDVLGVVRVGPRDDALVHVLVTVVDEREEVAQRVEFGARGVDLGHQDHRHPRRPVLLDDGEHALDRLLQRGLEGARLEQRVDLFWSLRRSAEAITIGSRSLSAAATKRTLRQYAMWVPLSSTVGIDL